MKEIILIDAGTGNLRSVQKALEFVGANVERTDDPKKVLSGKQVVLPGVGAFGDFMSGLKSKGLDEAVKEVVARGVSMLGICVGMQALFGRSEENDGVDCLGVLGGDVKRFDDHWLDDKNERIKVPHMGWNTITHMDLAHPLWQGIEDNTHFYFVHSFYCVPSDTSIVAATCDYGVEFCASVIKDNLFATQFHPEKSHTAGLQLLKNFVEWKI